MIIIIINIIVIIISTETIINIIIIIIITKSDVIWYYLGRHTWLCPFRMLFTSRDPWFQFVILQK